MEEIEDILIQSFIIFIKDDGKLTDRDILNGLEYPNHRAVKEEEYPNDNNVRIGRYKEWIYILDDASYENWHRSETWKFISRIAKEYDLIHCMMEDVVDGGMFGYHKDGKLLRLFDYKQKGWFGEEMKTTISEGEQLSYEKEALKDRHLWFMRLAMMLGVDIKKSDKDFVLYDDFTIDEEEYQKRYSIYSQENPENPNRYTPYNYYKK